MSDIVPVVFAIRASLNEEKSIDEQTDAVVDAMLRLERVYSNFDELAIVMAAKQEFSEHVVLNGSDINVKSHTHVKGFEPIKRSLIHSHVPDGLSGPELTDYKFKSMSNKKQKSGGFSYAFDFDSMPMFESLDSILESLRANVGDQAALHKLLGMEMCDFLDHPLWEEAMQILLRSLRLATSVEHSSLVLTLLHRFLHGFAGSQQGLDTSVSVLRYLFDLWVVSKQPLSAGLAVGLLTLFATILRTGSQNLQVPDQKETDKALLLIFWLCGCGHIRVLREDSTVAVKTVWEAILSTKDGANNLLALVRVGHPFTAFSYAVETGLLRALLNSIAHTHTSSADWTTSKLLALKLRLMLALVCAFDCSSNPAVTFLDSRKLPTQSQFDLQSFQWPGTAADFAATLKSRDCAVPLEGTNKRFLHLNQSASVLPALSGACAAGQCDGALLRWALDSLTALRGTLERCFLSTDPVVTEGTDALRLGEVLRLCLQLCACYQPATTLSTSEMTERLIHEVICLGKLILEGCAASVSAKDAIKLGLLEGLRDVLEMGSSTDALLLALLGWGVLDSAKSSAQVQEAALTLCMEYLQRTPSGPLTAAVTEQLLVPCLGGVDAMLRAGTVAADRHRLTSLQLCALQCVGEHCPPQHALHVARALLTALMSPAFFAFHTVDFRTRITASLLHLLRREDAGFVSQSLLGQSEREVIVAALAAESRHPDVFDRALCADDEIVGMVDVRFSFPAVWLFLCGLMETGHNHLLEQLPWSMEPDLPFAAVLGDLPALHAQVISGHPNTAVLECEGVHLYVLRLLAAGLHSDAYIARLKTALSVTGPSAPEEAEDCAGVVPRSRFCELTEGALREGAAWVQSQPTLFSLADGI